MRDRPNQQFTYISKTDHESLIEILSFDESTVVYQDKKDHDVRFEMTRLNFDKQYALLPQTVPEPAGHHILRQETLIDAPISQVFDFFSKAENVLRLTPKSLNARILTPLPISMRVGTLIDYRLSRFGVPFKWKTKIEIWNPLVRFVDCQMTGPYKLWRHEHSFEEVGTQTRMKDEVRYSISAWIFEPLVYRLFVGPQTGAIFAYRNKAVKEIFAGSTVVQTS